MAQEKVWENEYRNSKLVTKHDQPQSSVLKFFKYLKKKEKIDISLFFILDLGCGTGRNANYLAQKGAKVIGIDISPTALGIARKRAIEMEAEVEYFHQNIGTTYNFADNSFDLILDITSSNSLNEAERQVYLQEINRCLKPGGYLFVRTLCKDGDKNAKYLLKNYPGVEYDTYKMPELNLVERVFSKEDFVKMYSPNFKILEMNKDTAYTSFKNQSYKRNFWAVYMQKK